MKLLLALALALSAYAQSPPKNWAACGLGFDGSRGSAACALALSLTPNVFSWTAYEIQATRVWPPSPTTSTGIATTVGTFSLPRGAALKILVLGTAGITQTPSSISAAFAGGGAASLVLRSHFSFTAVLRQQTGASRGEKLDLLVGYSW